MSLSARPFGGLEINSCVLVKWRSIGKVIPLEWQKIGKAMHRRSHETGTSTEVVGGSTETRPNGL